MLNTEAQVPKYIQLYEALKRQINTEWSAGDSIPTEPELCRMYSVSTSTVRNAVSKLVQEGLLEVLHEACLGGHGLVLPFL